MRGGIARLPDPESWYVTHIFDGEEVVRGGADGQTWIATFEDPFDAQAFIDTARKAKVSV